MTHAIMFANDILRGDFDAARLRALRLFDARGDTLRAARFYDGINSLARSPEGQAELRSRLPHPVTA